MPRGRNQMSYFGQCPENEMAHMQRPPGPCFDNYPKMDGHCGMGVSEFKSPMMNADPAPPPAKKKRRTSNNMSAAAQQSPTIMQDLCPPPPSGYGDTVVASNPFDDTPSMPPMSHMNPMNHVNKHMGVGPCMSPAGPPMMGSMSPCHIVGSPMPCGPPVGSPINCGPPMGNCSPMGGAGNNTNLGPVGSPHTGCNSRQVSRSPLVGMPMNANSVMGNSPMNSAMPMNRSPSSMGSPLSSVMGSNVRGNSPLDCGLNINSVGSQKGSPMSVMSSHNISNLNCGSPMGSPSNVPLNNCNSNMMGSPIPSPLSNVPCGLGSGGGNPDLGINLNSVMNRSPHSAPPPNAMSASMMCNPAMRGPSPISSGPMNGPMGMNCNSNPSMMNQKPDMNMSDLAMRDNCGPGHLSMKPNNGPGNISCTRPSDLAAMQCGPMNSQHCGPMMNNQCLPNMGHGPCIGNGMNRAPCPPGMGMNIPFDGMNPQFRPAMNRSQFPRGMTNIPYGPQSMNGPMNGPPMNGPMNGPMNSPMNGPMNSPMNGPMNSPMNGPMNSPMNGPMNSPMNGPMNSPMNGPMNSPMNGPMNSPINGPPMNSPMNNPMNGPNLGNMCGPAELNNLPGCSPNNSTGLHCVGDQGPPPPPMNNAQCMNPNAMNQCPPPQPPNSMFNPSFNQFDVNNSRCSPNLNFHPNDMNVNSSFYRGPNVNNASPAPCRPNMHPAVVSTSPNDILGVTDSIVNSGNGSKNDSSTVDSDIASVVCGITSDAADDLNLLGDELLRDTKPDEQQQRKSIKEFDDSHLILGDDVVGVVKEEELESKPDKGELDATTSGDETKRDAGSDKRDSLTPVLSTSSSPTTTSACTTSNTSSSTTTSVTSGTEVTAAASESVDDNSCAGGSAAAMKSGDGASEDDDFVFKGGNSSGVGGASETLSNTSNSNAGTENEGSTLEDPANDDKIKSEPSEDKQLDSDFDDNGHRFHKILGDNKSDVNSSAGNGSTGNAVASGEDSGSTAASGPVQGVEKEAGKAAVPTSGLVKMEGEELFDGGMPGGLRKNDCPTPGAGIRAGGNSFTGPPNMMSGGAPPVNFNMHHANDMVQAGMMPNPAGCMNDALSGNPMLSNMGRPGLPHNANHATNFPNRNVCKVYPINKSKVYNSQNPNAPPTYNCGKCHEKINDNDQAILCESGCHYWYHRSCSGLSEVAYQLLTNEIYAEWACDTCLNTKTIPLVKYKP